MDDDYGAAQPLIDLVNKYHDNVSKVLNMIPTFGVKPMADKVEPVQKMNWTPAPNDEQKKAIENQYAPTKAPETKPLSQRTLGGAKRPAIKKPVTTQTQRKQP